MLESFRYETFSSRVGEVFRLSSPPAAPIDARLVSVTLAPGVADAAERGLRAPFSLTFRAQRNPVLPQRIYRLEHDTLGSLELFLVPIGPDAEGMCYEAAFT